jgi:hypothetical protein
VRETGTERKRNRVKGGYRVKEGDPQTHIHIQRERRGRETERKKDTEFE